MKNYLYDENEYAACEACGRIHKAIEMRSVNCGTALVCEACSESTSGLSSQCVGCVGRYMDSECNRCFDDALVCA